MKNLKVTNRVPEFDRTLNAVIKNRVLVGVPAANARRPDGKGITNALIGYMNETGDPERNLPARPHLVPGVLSVRDQIVKKLKAGAMKAFAKGYPDREAVDKAMHDVGLTAVSAVRAQITSGLTPPLAEVTLERRKERKNAPRTGETPLLDTGGYLRSMTYVIRRKA